MSEKTPLTILGAPDAEACVDDACLLPSPESPAVPTVGSKRRIETRRPEPLVE